MRVLFLAASALLLSGCASTPPAAESPQDTSASLADPRGVEVYDGRNGSVVLWEDLVAEAAAADVVVIGEIHGHPLGLGVAAALWEDVLARSPGAVLSMEFFERDEQSRLDEYLQGVVDEPAFLKRTARSSGNYPPGHRAMVEAARAAGRPVIAANAPRPHARLARTDGFDRLRALTPEQRRNFRIPDALPGGRYREKFFELMGGMAASHDPGAPADAAEWNDRAESFFRAQSLWDWTMAESVALALGRGERPVVHVVGQFHSDFDGGLLQSLRAMAPGATVVTLSVVDDTTIALRDEDRGRADFVVYVGPASAAFSD